MAAGGLYLNLIQPEMRRSIHLPRKLHPRTKHDGERMTRCCYGRLKFSQNVWIGPKVDHCSVVNIVTENGDVAEFGDRFGECRRIRISHRKRRLSPNWALLRQLGCPDKFVSIIRSFHDGMTARVVDVAGLSEPFAVRNGTKHGCVLDPLFSTYSMQPCFWMPSTAMAQASTSITEQTDESSIFAGWLLNPKSLSY